MLSETFVVNQIVTAIKLGYDVKILVEEVCDIETSGNSSVFQEFDLQNKIIPETYSIPSHRIHRVLKGLRLLLANPALLIFVFKLYKKTERRDLLGIYQVIFYSQFREIDIIHIQFGTNKTPVDIIKKCGLLSCKVVTSFHGHDLYFPINNTIAQEGYYNILFQISDYLICNTPFLEERLTALGAPHEKVEVVPVTVDTDYFKPAVKNPLPVKVRLITVGRLDELKGQELGIRAVKNLVERGLEVEYSIAGEGMNLQKLRKLVDELDLSEIITFHGRVSREEVLQLLRVSDIFLMTSVTNSAGMQESQGLVTAEAQACGLPVVAFDSGGIKYTIQNNHTGFLIKEKDVEDFSNKIELLIKNPDLRRTFGENAVHYVKRYFSEDSVMEKWRRIYG